MELYGELIICSDSILRIKSSYNEKEVSYPLKDIQSFLKEEDAFILQFFSSNIHIEEGATLSNLILSLEPWAKILSYYTRRDVAAYCNACKSENNEEQYFNFLEISKSSFTGRYSEFLPREKDESFLTYLNREDTRIKTKYFEIESFTRMCGFNEGDNSNYSASSEFELIKNTPVVLVSKQQNLYSKYDDNILNTSIDGVESGKNGDSFYSIGELSFLDIINAVFIDGLFYEKPMSKESSNALKEILDVSMEEVKKFKEDNKSHLSVVSENGEVKEEGKQLIISTGAFDGLIESQKEIMSDWDVIHQSLLNSSSIKIGNLKTAEREISYQYEDLKKGQ